jgi:hypothetical protein
VDFGLIERTQFNVRIQILTEDRRGVNCDPPLGYYEHLAPLILTPLIFNSIAMWQISLKSEK